MLLAGLRIGRAVSPAQLRRQQQHAFGSLSRVIFIANAESDVGARDGKVKSFGEHHGNLDLKLEKHPDQGGKGGGTNPEELFACGYAVCFNGALRLVAVKNGIKIGHSRVKVSVSLCIEPEEVTAAIPFSIGLAAKVIAEIQGVYGPTAQKCADLAHEFCPFSRATGQHGRGGCWHCQVRGGLICQIERTELLN
mmetsp:Transcript_139616/g.445563  ORF Transcript_139616/g.445563 Transcript_139616/m.445563 type:complete len:194 (-) Transcript_139616:52-633(-)